MLAAGADTARKGYVLDILTDLRTGFVTDTAHSATHNDPLVHSVSGLMLSATTASHASLSTALRISHSTARATVSRNLFRDPAQQPSSGHSPWTTKPAVAGSSNWIP